MTELEEPLRKTTKRSLVIQPNTSNTQKRVLIIEDMSEMRSMLKSLITSLGYTNIDVEPSGQAAIKRLLNSRYDIVLSDYNLGGTINGQQILEITRKIYALDHSTIFIMVTADITYENVVSVLEYQPDSYLVKPFTPAAFHRRFERVQKQKSVFDEINQFRKAQDFSNMEIKAREIMKQSPRFNSLCLKIIGESLFARHRYREAKSHYMLVINEHKNFAWAHHGIALCEMKLGNTAAAIDNLANTIELSRHFLSAYDLLADAHEKQGNYDAAQAAMLTVIEVSPYSIDRSVRLGKLSTQIQDWKSAEQAYSKVLRLTRDTSEEKVEYYYNYLHSITNLIESGDTSSKLTEKFRRALTRLRYLGKDNPIVVSNSFRAEVQQYLSRDHHRKAIKSWQQWNQMIDKGIAAPIKDTQVKVIKHRLGLL